MNHTPLKWTIGDVEILQIVEIEELNIFSSFIPQATPENIQKIDWLFPNFASEDGNLKALVQSFLIKSNGKNILIDTCNGNHRDRPNVPEWGGLNTDYLERFKDRGVTPEEIDFVTCTHFHFDHVGWNTKLENGTWVPTFPNATYLFSKGEYEYWVQKPEKEIVDDFNGFDESITPIVEAGLAEFVEDTHQIDDNVRFLPTPGHTPHHISIEVTSNNQRAIISGDVLHHPCQMIHPEWTTLADTYPDQTIETRKKFLQEIVNTDTLLIGSHFYYPVAGKVVGEGDGMMLKI